MDALSSLNPVRTRNRARSIATTLPIPLSPEHTNHRHSRQDTTNWRRSQPEISTSAPMSNINRLPNTDSFDPDNLPLNNSGVDGSPSCIGLSFEDGAHAVIRPNRIIRGKLEQQKKIIIKV